MTVRVEWSAQALFRFDRVATQQLVKLLERNLNALAELLSGARSLSAESPFEIVDYRQQFADKSFLLRRRAALGFLCGSLAEVIEVRGKAQISIFLGSHLGLQRVAPFLGRFGFGRSGIRVRVHIYL